VAALNPSRRRLNVRIDERIAKLCPNIHTTTLTVFPNNSIPLTLPESWRGKGHTSRNYQHLTKRLALLLITSPQCEELPPSNMAALKRKLSAF
jgi:hypothetical protein